MILCLAAVSATVLSNVGPPRPGSQYSEVSVSVAAGLVWTTGGGFRCVCVCVGLFVCVRVCVRACVCVCRCAFCV